MRLTRFTDYSLRVLIYLGLSPDEWVTIRQISEAYGISRNHLMKVVSSLAQLEYVKSQRGPGGGIRLSRMPEDIKLADVVRDAEGDVRLVECFDTDNSCVLTPSCSLKIILGEALVAFFDSLEGHTLQDIIQPRKKLSHLAGIPCKAA